MSRDNQNFFELCNDILEELYYDPVDTFAELAEIPEGKRVKKLLNRALVTICNNENANWQFKEVMEPIILVAGQSTYNKPNGFIRYIKRPKDNLVLTYCENHKYLPYTTGEPVNYWMDGEQIKFFPVPDTTGMQLNVEYYTNNYAFDCQGIGKLEMNCECDVPIIPNKHRQILIWRVCADWRANDGDGKSQYYERKYREAYRAMRMDCIQTEDYPSGLSLDSDTPSIADSINYAFEQKYRTSRGNM